MPGQQRRRRKMSNLLALAVLSYLSQRPMHPYELGRTLRDHGDDRSVKYNHGSLYMVVQQLAKANLIAAQETRREGQRPERTIYAITDAGRRELRDWLRDLVAEPRFEHPQFITALAFIAALPPGEVVELLEERGRRLAIQLAETRELIEQTLSAGVHPLFLVEEDFRRTLLEAEVAFVARLVEQITHPKTGWQQPWAEIHGAAGSPTQTKDA